MFPNRQDSLVDVSRSALSVSVTHKTFNHKAANHKTANHKTANQKTANHKTANLKPDDGVNTQPTADRVQCFYTGDRSGNNIRPLPRKRMKAGTLSGNSPSPLNTPSNQRQIPSQREQTSESFENRFHRRPRSQDRHLKQPKLKLLQTKPMSRLPIPKPRTSKSNRGKVQVYQKNAYDTYPGTPNPSIASDDDISQDSLEVCLPHKNLSSAEITNKLKSRLLEAARVKCTTKAIIKDLDDFQSFLNSQVGLCNQKTDISFDKESNTNKELSSETSEQKLLNPIRAPDKMIHDQEKPTNSLSLQNSDTSLDKQKTEIHRQHTSTEQGPLIRADRIYVSNNVTPDECLPTSPPFLPSPNKEVAESNITEVSSDTTNSANDSLRISNQFIDNYKTRTYTENAIEKDFAKKCDESINKLSIKSQNAINKIYSKNGNENECQSISPTTKSSEHETSSESSPVNEENIEMYNYSPSPTKRKSKSIIYGNKPEKTQMTEHGDSVLKPEKDYVEVAHFSDKESVISVKKPNVTPSNDSFYGISTNCSDATLSGQDLKSPKIEKDNEARQPIVIYVANIKKPIINYDEVNNPINADDDYLKQVKSFDQDMSESKCNNIWKTPNQRRPKRKGRSRSSASESRILKNTNTRGREGKTYLDENITQSVGRSGGRTSSIGKISMKTEPHRQHSSTADRPLIRADRIYVRNNVTPDVYLPSRQEDLPKQSKNSRFTKINPYKSVHNAGLKGLRAFQNTPKKQLERSISDENMEVIGVAVKWWETGIEKTCPSTSEETPPRTNKNTNTKQYVNLSKNSKTLPESRKTVRSPRKFFVNRNKNDSRSPQSIKCATGYIKRKVSPLKAKEKKVDNEGNASSKTVGHKMFQKNTTHLPKYVLKKDTLNAGKLSTPRSSRLWKSQQAFKSKSDSALSYKNTSKISNEVSISKGGDKIYRTGKIKGPRKINNCCKKRDSIKLCNTADTTKICKTNKIKRSRKTKDCSKNNDASQVFDTDNPCKIYKKGTIKDLRTINDRKIDSARKIDVTSKKDNSAEINNAAVGINSITTALDKIKTQMDDIYLNILDNKKMISLQPKDQKDNEIIHLNEGLDKRSESSNIHKDESASLTKYKNSTNINLNKAGSGAFRVSKDPPKSFAKLKGYAEIFHLRQTLGSCKIVDVTHSTHCGDRTKSTLPSGKFEEDPISTLTSCAGKLDTKSTIASHKVVEATISTIDSCKDVEDTVSTLAPGHFVKDTKSILEPCTVSNLTLCKGREGTIPTIASGKCVDDTISTTTSCKGVENTTSALASGKSVEDTTSTLTSRKYVDVTISTFASGKSVVVSTSQDTSRLIDRHESKSNQRLDELKIVCDSKNSNRKDEQSLDKLEDMALHPQQNTSNRNLQSGVECRIPYRYPPEIKTSQYQYEFNNSSKICENHASRRTTLHQSHGLTNCRCSLCGSAFEATNNSLVRPHFLPRPCSCYMISQGQHGTHDNGFCMCAHDGTCGAHHESRGRRFRDFYNRTSDGYGWTNFNENLGCCHRVNNIVNDLYTNNEGCYNRIACRHQNHNGIAENGITNKSVLIHNRNLHEYPQTLYNHNWEEKISNTSEKTQEGPFWCHSHERYDMCQRQYPNSQYKCSNDMIQSSEAKGSSNEHPIDRKYTNNFKQRLNNKSYFNSKIPLVQNKPKMIKPSMGQSHFPKEKLIPSHSKNTDSTILPSEFKTDDISPSTNTESNQINDSTFILDTSEDSEDFVSRLPKSRIPVPIKYSGKRLRPMTSKDTKSTNTTVTDNPVKPLPSKNKQHQSLQDFVKTCNIEKSPTTIKHRPPSSKLPVNKLLTKPSTPPEGIEKPVKDWRRGKFVDASLQNVSDSTSNEKKGECELDVFRDETNIHTIGSLPNKNDNNPLDRGCFSNKEESKPCSTNNNDEIRPTDIDCSYAKTEETLVDHSQKLFYDEDTVVDISQKLFYDMSNNYETTSHSTGVAIEGNDVATMWQCLDQDKSDRRKYRGDNMANNNKDIPKFLAILNRMTSAVANNSLLPVNISTEIKRILAQIMNEPAVDWPMATLPQSLSSSTEEDVSVSEPRALESAFQWSHLTHVDHFNENKQLNWPLQKNSFFDKINNNIKSSLKEIRTNHSKKDIQKILCKDIAAELSSLLEPDFSVTGHNKQQKNQNIDQSMYGILNNWNTGNPQATDSSPEPPSPLAWNEQQARQLEKMQKTSSHKQNKASCKGGGNRAQKMAQGRVAIWLEPRPTLEDINRNDWNTDKQTQSNQNVKPTHTLKANRARQQHMPVRIPSQYNPKPLNGNFSLLQKAREIIRKRTRVNPRYVSVPRGSGHKSSFYSCHESTECLKNYDSFENKFNLQSETFQENYNNNEQRSSTVEDIYLSVDRAASPHKNNSLHSTSIDECSRNGLKRNIKIKVLGFQSNPIILETKPNRKRRRNPLLRSHCECEMSSCELSPNKECIEIQLSSSTEGSSTACSSVTS